MGGTRVAWWHMASDPAAHAKTEVSSDEHGREVAAEEEALFNHCEDEDVGSSSADDPSAPAAGAPPRSAACA